MKMAISQGLGFVQSRQDSQIRGNFAVNLPADKGPFAYPRYTAPASPPPSSGAPRAALTREELVARYAEKPGMAVGGFDLFRLAVIAQ